MLHSVNCVKRNDDPSKGHEMIVSNNISVIVWTKYSYSFEQYFLQQFLHFFSVYSQITNIHRNTKKAQYCADISLVTILKHQTQNKQNANAL